MHRFWESVVGPLLESTHARIIVEIGVGAGENTRNLLAYCEKHGGVLHNDMSLTALHTLKRADAILIDGDHNWYTVYHELTTIERVMGEHGFPLVILHDVDWPYGRRDAYEDPGRIPDTFLQPYARKGVGINGTLLPEGGLNPHLFHAFQEGGACNGVRTAVEDFLRPRQGILQWKTIPGLHGLGVLFSSALLLDHAPLQQFLESLSWPLPFAKHVAAIDHDRITADWSYHALLPQAARLVKQTALCQSLEAQLHQCTAKLQETTENYERVLQSRSWRWTRHLRKTEASLRHFLPRAIPVPQNVPSPPLTGTLPRMLPHAERPIDVIIPIHNAGEATSRCLESVLAARIFCPEHRIVLIDDGSTDEQLLSHLEDVRQWHVPGLLILRNAERLGFVRTVNRGCALSPTHDVLLLNSDTVVSGAWLQSLAQSAYHHPCTASVTPLSNNASTYSVLGGPAITHLLEHLPFAKIAQRIAAHSLSLLPEIPVGVGFCMYLRREALDAVGDFDTIFAEGYGEESEWCLRTRAAGFHHFLDDACFVFHEGGVSMRRAGHHDPQADHRMAHEALIHERFPSYPHIVRDFSLYSDAMPKIRTHVEALFYEELPRVPSRPLVPPPFLTQHPDIAVIVPCHNYSQYLGEALESVLTQTLPPADILVVNDASIDATPTVAQSFAGRGVRMIRIEEHDVSMARNIGASHTSAPFLLFLDADDLLPPHYNATCRAAMEDPTVAIAYGDLLHFGENSGTDTMPPFDQDALEEWNVISSHALIRRSAFESVHGYRTLPVAEDWDLYRRILRGIWLARKVPTFVHYRTHSDSRGQQQHPPSLPYSDYATLAGHPITILALFMDGKKQEEAVSGLRMLTASHGHCHLLWHKETGKMLPFLEPALRSISCESARAVPLPPRASPPLIHLLSTLTEEYRSPYALVVTDDALLSGITLPPLLRSLDRQTVALVPESPLPSPSFLFLRLGALRKALRHLQKEKQELTLATLCTALRSCGTVRTLTVHAPNDVTSSLPCTTA